MEHDFDARIDAIDGLLGGLSFWSSDILGAMNDLPLQVGKIHRIEINNPKPTDPGRRQIHRDGRAKSSRADAEHTG
jgi:hypothetical protein